MVADAILQSLGSSGKGSLAVASGDVDMASYLAHSLPLGPLLEACDTQDITRKGAKKNRSHVLMFLPQHFAFDKSCDHEVGTLEDANTNTPTFVVRTQEELLRFPGRFVSTTTAFFTLECGLRAQSVLSEMYQFVLVFGAPTVEALSAANKLRGIEAKPAEAPTAAGSAAAEASLPTSTKQEGSQEWVSQHGLSGLVPGKVSLPKKKAGGSTSSSSGERVRVLHTCAATDAEGSDGDVVSISSTTSDAYEAAASKSKDKGTKAASSSSSSSVSAAVAPSRRSAGKRSCAKAASQSSFYDSSSEGEPTSDVSDSVDSDDTDDYEDSPVRKRRR